MSMALSPPWFAYMEFAVGSSFAAITVGQTDLVTLFDFKGKTLGNIRVEMKTRAITDEDVDRELENMPSPFLALVRGNREALTPEENYPSILSLLVDDEDRIWVTGPNLTEGKPYQVAVYDRAYKMLKQGTIPEAPAVVSKSHAYFLQDDADGDIILKRCPLTL